MRRQLPDHALLLLFVWPRFGPSLHHLDCRLVVAKLLLAPRLALLGIGVLCVRHRLRRIRYIGHGRASSRMVAWRALTWL
jgi:hypothetical protein